MTAKELAVNTLTKRHLALENVILALALLNLAAPWLDPQHPAQWVYAAFAWAFQWWIDAVGWVMSWSDPLLPRTFTFHGVANLVFATLLTGLALLVLYAIWKQLYKRLWFRQWVQRLALPFSFIRHNVPALIVVMLFLLAALTPTLLRLAFGQLTFS